eukprot:8421748-Alexandrium_andersonii.AAC.1
MQIRARRRLHEVQSLPPRPRCRNCLLQDRQQPAVRSRLAVGGAQVCVQLRSRHSDGSDKPTATGSGDHNHGRRRRGRDDAPTASGRTEAT